MVAEEPPPPLRLRERPRLLLAASALVVVAVAVILAVIVLPRYVYLPPAPYRSTIAAGADFSCAVTDAGAVRCWGANDDGQLGDGTFAPHPRPVAVQGVSGAVAVTAGDGTHACALTAAGAVWCWGANASGQLGDATTTTHPIPQPVQGLPGRASAVSAGRAHTCALVGADLYCWGSNTAGELGARASTDPVLQPRRVQGLPGGVVAASAGTGFTCAVTDRGRAFCWGENGDGQLGGPGVASSAVPVQVPVPDARFDAITAGDTHACALTRSDVFCWGANAGGERGDGTRIPSPAPNRVAGLTGAESVSAGHARTCATTSEQSVLCWGDAGADDIDAPRPVPVPQIPAPVSGVAVGRFHACTLSSRDRVSCWGVNTTGQLGDGSTTDRREPVSVSID
ncbi:hypothetical protein [uncultured Microbacterium sp.]|uniref:RCC1 domain-containing protein n=1 Tax=uncultured Microbacterium sp. TaxID=191216 RepID=UPI0025EA8C19|nr:hypothetical protein [uncultured Microbacterium sp.]